MIPDLAGEYRAMIADLANALTGISVPRARAEPRKLAIGRGCDRFVSVARLTA
jgi:hypothetical protein